MAETKPQKTKTQNDYISDSDTSKDKVSQNLHTSQKERLYGTVKGLVQVTQAALAHTMAQCNLMVERGPPRQPKIKKLSKDQASEKVTQTNDNVMIWKNSRVPIFLFPLTKFNNYF